MNDHDDEVGAHLDPVSREPRALTLLRFVLHVVVLLLPILVDPDPAPGDIFAESTIGPEKSPEFVPELDGEYDDLPLRWVSKSMSASAEHLGAVSKATTVSAEHLGSVSSAA